METSGYVIQLGCQAQLTQSVLHLTPCRRPCQSTVVLGIERLALVMGGEIASTFDDPEHLKLGHCDLIEEIMIGEDKVIKFSGCALGESCTIVLRGASMHILDEAERSLHDALCVLQQVL